MKILVVTTSNAQFEGSNPHPTGVWLDEFTEPYMEFHRHGVNLVVASPKGGQMPIDPRTLPTAQQEIDWAQALAAARNTVLLSTVTAEGFDGIFLPGGHGPMFDLPTDKHLASLLQDFYAQGKIIAGVCHGPCGFVKATRPNGEPLVKGVTLTSYTYSEEVAAKLDQEVPFILEHRLKELGANFIPRENRADHVERDGQFITGQNPWSSKSVALAVMSVLQKQFQPPLNIVATEIVEAQTVRKFPLYTFVENIIIDSQGRIFLSSLDEGMVYRLDPDGQEVKFPLERPAGLAFDAQGNLLVASSIGSKAPGIYQVQADGKTTLLVPMTEAVFLNGIVHLQEDRYLLADSYQACIWEADITKGTAHIWLQHPTLAHAADPFHPVPEFPGVNGLKIFGDTLYASSTQQQKLVRIPLNADGSAGTPEVFMTSINLDDFAFDTAGNLYGTTHVYNSVVHISPDRQITVIAGLAQGAAGSTAVAFGHETNDLYVTTNGGMSSPPPGGVQPARLVRLTVGATGYEREV